MGVIMSLVGGLLSWLHDGFATNACPGGWLWAVVLAGVVLALSALLGMVLVLGVLRALARRGGVARGPLFAVVAPAGVVFALVLPMAFTTAVSSLFGQAAARLPVALSSADLTSLAGPVCTGTGTQLDYLGTGPTVLAALTRPAPDVYPQYLGLLVGLPLLSLVLVWACGRIALRGGPAWAPALYALAFLGFLLFTGGDGGNVVAQLWLGATPVLGAGALLFRALPRVPFAPAPPAPPPFAPAPPRPTIRTPSPSPLPPTAHLAPPDPAPAGRFQRIRRLGAGGFGTVWLAQDTQLGRTVALKIAHAPDAAGRQRMLREARALAAVHHPHCVRIYDVVQDGDGLAIVMQYIEGSSLGEAVRRGGPLDDVSAARLWLTMAGALGAAHAKGVLHRDVKPSNIVIDWEDTPHLLDFGIARTSGDTTLTATGMTIGTPDYLAPEAARTGASTTASDAWQLAATVSFALTGRPPRGAKDNVMAALAAASGAQPCTELPAHSAHRPLLASALDPEPAARPSLADVREALACWLADNGHSADGPVTAVIDGRDDVTRPVR